jgi:hypothetical protein
MCAALVLGKTLLIEVKCNRTSRFGEEISDFCVTLFLLFIFALLGFEFRASSLLGSPLPLKPFPHPVNFILKCLKYLGEGIP